VIFCLCGFGVGGFVIGKLQAFLRLFDLFFFNYSKLGVGGTFCILGCGVIRFIITIINNLTIKLKLLISI